MRYWSSPNELSATLPEPLQKKLALQNTEYWETLWCPARTATAPRRQEHQALFPEVERRRQQASRAEARRDSPTRRNGTARSSAPQQGPNTYATTNSTRVR
ncbi:plasmid replication region DNA-binding n-term domain-containing protein [Cordyceps javanica]|nr:plasmid replication region DNA-binding n-term domain-containing protein [Cordyceps javanica]